MPHGMWDLSFLTRDQTCAPCIGRQSHNHWTTQEVIETTGSTLENSSHFYILGNCYL